MTDRLFNGDPLELFGDEAVAALEQAVLDLEADQVANTPAVIEALVKAHAPQPPTLHRDRIVFEGAEAELDGFDLLSRPRKRWGVRFTFHVPFAGDPRVFELAGGAPPGTPQGVVKDHSLILTVSAPISEENIGDLLEDRLKDIESALLFQSRYFERLKTDMRQVCETALLARQNRLDILDRLSLALEDAGYENAAKAPGSRHRKTS